MQSDWFQPLGMHSSSFIWREADEPHMAHPHRKGKPYARPFCFKEALSAASLYTTIVDYARFAAQVLFPPEADTHHLSPVWLENMLTPQVDAGVEMAWGLGWGLAGSDGQKLAWQWGDNRGLKHIVVISPAMQRGIIVLTNNEQGYRVWKEVLIHSLDPGGIIFTWLDNLK